MIRGSQPSLISSPPDSRAVSPSAKVVTCPAVCPLSYGHMLAPRARKLAMSARRRPWCSAPHPHIIEEPPPETQVMRRSPATLRAGLAPLAVPPLASMPSELTP